MAKKTKIRMCKNCNTPIAKNAKFCPSCGAKNKKPFYTKRWFILVLILAMIGIVSFVKGNIRERFDWKEAVLCDRLPKPKSNIGSIISNDSEKLSIHVEKTGTRDYMSYMEECQALGYTLDSEKTGDVYTAFNEEGYRLELKYIGETMYIELEAPVQMGVLIWPKSEIASLLPIPKSAVGKVTTDTADNCYIYIGETKREDFNTYADDCSSQGFSVDYERGDSFYNAKDENGNQLSVSYQGNEVMTIQIRKSDELTMSETESEVSSVEESGIEIEEDSAELTDGIRPEFKEAMDSYEAFYDEYCDFLQKYNENPSDLQLIAEYTDILERAADMHKKFAEWEEQDLSDEELMYYVEVNGRIAQKLLEIGE